MQENNTIGFYLEDPNANGNQHADMHRMGTILPHGHGGGVCLILETDSVVKLINQDKTCASEEIYSIL